MGESSSPRQQSPQPKKDPSPSRPLPASSSTSTTQKPEKNIKPTSPEPAFNETILQKKLEAVQQQQVDGTGKNHNQSGSSIPDTDMRSVSSTGNVADCSSKISEEED